MSQEKKKKTVRKLTANELQKEVLQYLLKQVKKKFTPRQLVGLLKIENNKDSVEHALRQLEELGRVAETKDGKFGATAKSSAAHPFFTPAPKENAASENDPEPSIPETFEPEIEQSISKKQLRTITNVDRRQSRQSDKAPPRPRKMIEGRIDMTRTGAGYLVSESMDSDVYINPRYMNGALHGDRVALMLFSMPNKVGRRDQVQRKPEGEVIKILKRASEFFIGTL